MLRDRLTQFALGLLLSATSGCVFLDTGGGGGTGDGSDDDSVVTPGNSGPTASAGGDLTVTAGDSVVLDATASSDPDGDRLLFTWQQTAGAPDVEILSASASRPRFVAPQVTAPTALTFRVTVTDGRVAVADEVVVVVTPGT